MRSVQTAPVSRAFARAARVGESVCWEHNVSVERAAMKDQHHEASWRRRITATWLGVGEEMTVTEWLRLSGWTTLVGWSTRRGWW